MALKCPWLLISASEINFSKWYKLSIKHSILSITQNWASACCFLDTRASGTRCSFMENMLKGYWGHKGWAAPENGHLSFTRLKCKWLPSSPYAKIKILGSRWTFFSPQVCKGQVISRCLLTCPLPIKLIQQSCRWPSAHSVLGKPSCHSLFWHTSSVPFSLQTWSDPEVRGLQMCLQLIAFQSLKVSLTAWPYPVTWSCWGYFNFCFVNLCHLL